MPLPFSEREGGVLLCLLQHPPPHTGFSYPMRLETAAVAGLPLPVRALAPAMFPDGCSLDSSKARHSVQTGLASSAPSVAACRSCYLRMLGQNPSPGTASCRAIGPKSWDVGPVCSMYIQLPLL